MTGRVGRGGAATEASENAASVIPTCCWRRRLSRGKTTPKPTAARMATAGTPTITSRSEDPKCVAQDDEVPVDESAPNPQCIHTKRAAVSQTVWQADSCRCVGMQSLLQNSCGDSTIEIGPGQD